MMDKKGNILGVLVGGLVILFIISFFYIILSQPMDHVSESFEDKVPDNFKDTKHKIDNVWQNWPILPIIVIFIYILYAAIRQKNIPPAFQ